MLLKNRQAEAIVGIVEAFFCSIARPRRPRRNEVDKNKQADVVLAEYQALRAEMLHSDVAMRTYLNIIVLAMTAILGFSLQYRQPLTTMLAYFVIIPLGVAILHRREGNYAITTYIACSMEGCRFKGLLSWEGLVQKYDKRCRPSRTVAMGVVLKAITVMPLLALSVIWLMTRFEESVWWQTDLAVSLTLDLIAAFVCWIYVVRPLSESGISLRTKGQRAWRKLLKNVK